MDVSEKVNSRNINRSTSPTRPIYRYIRRNKYGLTFVKWKNKYITLSTHFFLKHTVAVLSAQTCQGLRHPETHDYWPTLIFMHRPNYKTAMNFFSPDPIKTNTKFEHLATGCYNVENNRQRCYWCYWKTTHTHKKKINVFVHLERMVHLSPPRQLKFDLLMWDHQERNCQPKKILKQKGTSKL